LGQTIWVPRLALAMRRDMPLAHLRVVGIDPLISLGDLTSSEVDVHLGIPWKAPGIHVEPLCEEQSVLVARRAHPVFRRRDLRRSLDELHHVRVEMLPGKNLRDPFAAIFAGAGIRRDVVMTVPSFTTAAAVVAASDLVTMLTTSFMTAKGRELGLRAVDAPLPARPIALAMCWHERTHADPAARAFRAVVNSAIAGRHSARFAHGRRVAVTTGSV
jgi:DNA-binding transcriptional LysR family regulator